ncbi:MAG: MFS transporter [Acidobacteriota bacterium]|nr:MFS transporter [Acidobacteriota bacterium]
MNPALPQSAEARLDELYDQWFEDDGSRFCGELSEDACREVPGNFFLYVASLVLTKLGDALANPKTTLTWVMSAAGAPGALVGLLVPIRESGSMLPQIVLGGWVRRLAVRKWVWVLGSVLQALAIAGIGAAAAFTSGTTAGLLILAAVVVFSLSRSLSSMASKDVKGKILPKGRRGRAGGLAASISGALTMGVALALVGIQPGELSPQTLGLLLAAAGALWLLAAGLFARIAEEPGETDGSADFSDALERLRLLRRETQFRRFVLARALFVSTALAGPYYVLLARERAGEEISLLAYFVLAGGLASTLSSLIWGRWADRSSRRVMLTAAGLASVLGVLVFAVARWQQQWLDSPWVPLVGFFVLSIAHEGVRQGRKTHVVDMAEGNRRTDYVATANTLIGLVLLATSALGALVTWVGPEGMLLILALLGFAGIFVGRGLDEVQSGGR